MFKGVLIDLDDTLYNYKETHKIALDVVLSNLSEQYKNIGLQNLHQLYDKYHTFTYSILGNVASSHNKIFTFKKMLEFLEISDINQSVILNNIYWDTFYSHMQIYSHVKEFLQICKQKNIKIVIITDFMYEQQLVKLEKLGISSLIDYVITSEEMGIDKPNPIIFYYALNKLQLSYNEICIIGDNLHKDIIGAQNLKIYSFLFSPNSDNDLYGMIPSFNSFEFLYKFFQGMFNAIEQLVSISRLYGQRFDLVQAGGGNTSVKWDKYMFIKSSGCILSDVSIDKGYSIIDLKNNKSVINTNTRPSIETPLHTHLMTYVVHLHPIQVNKLTILKDGEYILHTLFPEALIIPYITPGIDLSLKLNSEYKGHSIIFLMSHGLIVTSNVFEDIKTIIDYVVDKIEKYFDIVAQYSQYKLTTKISDTIFELSGKKVITYLSHFDHKIQNIELLLTSYLLITPDTVVYCGPEILYLNIDFTKENFVDYFKRYDDYPKIVIIDKYIYMVSVSLKKCKEIEEVFKSIIMTVSDNDAKNIITISQSEVYNLINWDAEKFRINNS